MRRLNFAGTREHALLAFVIQEAGAHVPYMGRTALQKIMYFLKALDVPMRYHFEVYHYGPYCDQIPDDVALLTMDGVVIDKAANKPGYWNYAPMADGPISELLSDHAEFIAENRQRVRAVVKAFGKLRPEELELLATLHYAFRHVAAGRDSASRAVVINRFREFKGDKFKDSQINRAYDAMVSAGLIM